MKTPETIKDLFQETNKDNLIQLDERPLEELSEEEIESLLQEMTRQGLLKGDSKKGYTLTPKGKVQGRLIQMKSFFE